MYGYFIMIYCDLINDIHDLFEALQQINMLKAFTICLIFSLTQSLHLRHYASFDYSLNNTVKQFSKDYLEVNSNFYYGDILPQTYFNWVNQNMREGGDLAQECSPQLPYAVYKDGQSKCISCDPITSNINITSAKVLFNLGTRQCEVCTPYKTITCNNLLFSTLDQTNKPDNSRSKYQVLGLCPPQHPKYNPSSNKCEDCLPLQQFYGQKQKCIPIVFATNLKALNIVMPSVNSIDQQQYTTQRNNPTQLVRECPIQTPYLKGKVCVSCPNNKLFNLTSQECVQCGEGYFYNSITFTCDIGTYYPDATASNIVSQKSNYEQWKANVDRFSKASPRMIKCKPQTPFVVDSKCIKCEGSSPLFDIDNSRCVACSRGRTYDGQKRLCVSSYSSSGSLRLVIANAL